MERKTQCGILWKNEDASGWGTKQIAQKTSKMTKGSEKNWRGQDADALAPLVCGGSGPGRDRLGCNVESDRRD